MIFQVFVDDDKVPYTCEADFIPNPGIELDIQLNKHQGHYVVESVQTEYEMDQPNSIGAARLLAHVRLYLKKQG